MRRYIALLLVLPLIGCTSLAGSFGDVMNPQNADGLDAPPLAGMILVEDVGLVLAVDPPGITLGRRRVVISGARATTQSDAIDIRDTTSAAIINSQVVELGTSVSVSPTEDSEDALPE